MIHTGIGKKLSCNQVVPVHAIPSATALIMPSIQMPKWVVVIISLIFFMIIFVISSGPVRNGLNYWDWPKMDELPT